MQSGDILAGKYKLLKPIGEGGEASVFLAMHLQTEQFWAVKVLHGMRRSGSGCQEVEAMKSLHHPALPTVIDVLEQDGACAIVMEYIRGTSLDRSLKGGRALSEAQVLEVGIQTAEALVYLHSRPRPVLHLDIKPSNLIRRRDGRIMLVDFGASWKEDGRALEHRGTDGYAAPEQYDPARMPDERTDVYALGASLYRMTAGHTFSEVLRGSRIPGAGEEMQKILDRCLEERPEDRYRSAEELRRALCALRRKREKADRRRSFLGASALALPALAICLSVLPAQFRLSAGQEWDYERLLEEALLVGEEESRTYYRQAVLMNPAGSEAYLQYLEDADRDGVFSQEEEVFLRDLLHTVPLGRDRTNEEFLAGSPVSYASFCAQLGLIYWYDYGTSAGDGRRIAAGWLKKALAALPEETLRAPEEEARGASSGEALSASSEEAAQVCAWYEAAQLHSTMASCLDRLQSGGSDRAGTDPAGTNSDGTNPVAEYWRCLTQLLEGGTEGSLRSLSGVLQLRFCLESARQLAYMSAQLSDAGIGQEEIAGALSRLREIAASLTEDGQTRPEGLREEVMDALDLAEEVTAAEWKEEVMDALDLTEEVTAEEWKEEVMDASDSAVEVAAGATETETV